MGISIARKIERGIRYALLSVFVAGVRRRNPGAVVNAVVAAIGTHLPDFVEWVFDVELRPWQRVYVDTAMITHAVGMLGPYDEVWWWDHLTHAHSATILGSIVFAISRRRGRDPRPRVVAVVACLGVLWELLEYAIHVVARRVGVEPILVTYGPKDTALDLFFDLVGAALVLAFGDRVLANLSTEA
ncbi:hypothetical protein HALLA_20275 (plasmid) [Halostagnicola larsenii XH-48]|uniref:DUF2238 domain-containing protein n=1 Tax=Halostagnicola larsenii XH-48 TaxID=797299 RepID=W0JYF9_9EURY|nr:hypothetical protein [Halostagnicola larsenii]AHG02240.1 hypothetical protein HALLA_20275 [Halostagnicola larsenii XH-48]